MKPNQPTNAPRLLLILALAFLLVACGRGESEPTAQPAAPPSVATSTSAPTTAPEAPTEPAAVTPAVTPANAQTGPGQDSLPPDAKGGTFALEYSSPDGGFTVPLPEGWAVLAIDATPLGNQLLLGPGSLVAENAAVSKIIYADAAAATVDSAVEQLCAGNCNPLPQPEAFTLAERPAWRVTISGDPPQEWIFVDNGDILVYFSIFDPETRAAREDIVQAMRFSPVVNQNPQNEEIGMVVSQHVSQKLQLPADQVTVESVEPVEWSNSCLGAPAEGEMCAEVITPGYRVIVDAGGEQFELHTDSTGQEIRLYEAPE